jgi:hypothetical protein
MFQFAGFAAISLCIQLMLTGLPHSDISGSMLASSSPELIVGRHVLLRLCVPRYPPLALCNLTTFCFDGGLLVRFSDASDDLPAFDDLISMQFSRF